MRACPSVQAPLLISRLADAALALALFGALALGGAAQFGLGLTVGARLSALPALGLGLWLAGADRGAAVRDPASWLAAALVALPLLQLAPLPEAWVEALPGRAALLRPLAEVGAARPAFAPLSLTPAATYDAALAALGPAGLLLLGRRAGLGRPGWILGGLVGLAVGEAVLGVLQRAAGGGALRLYAVSSQGEAVGLFANRDHLAVFLVCVLPLIGWLAAEPGGAGTRRPGRALALAAAAAVTLGGVALTRSRAGAMLAAATLALTLLQLHLATSAAGARPARPGRGAAGGGLTAGALALAGGVLLAGLFAAGGGLARFGADGDLGARAQLWPPILRLAERFLPAGAGLGAFDPLWRSVEPFDRLTGVYLNHAHNDYLEGLLETGLPGALLLAAVLAGLARQALRAWRGDPAASGLARAGVMAAAVLLLHSAIDYPLRTPALASLFTLALVLAGAAPPGVGRARRPRG